MAEPTIYETHYSHPDFGARIAELELEIERLRLTDMERETVEWFAEVPKPLSWLAKSNRREHYIATLRGLLERTK